MSKTTFKDGRYKATISKKNDEIVISLRDTDTNIFLLMSADIDGIDRVVELVTNSGTQTRTFDEVK